MFQCAIKAPKRAQGAARRWGSVRDPAPPKEVLALVGCFGGGVGEGC